MAKTEETTALQPIETLAQQERTPAYILAGMKVANGWGSGKELTLEEYKKAMDAFLKGPMRRGVNG